MADLSSTSLGEVDRLVRYLVAAAVVEDEEETRELLLFAISAARGGGGQTVAPADDYLSPDVVPVENPAQVGPPPRASFSGPRGVFVAEAEVTQMCTVRVALQGQTDGVLVSLDADDREQHHYVAWETLGYEARPRHVASAAAIAWSPAKAEALVRVLDARDAALELHGVAETRKQRVRVSKVATATVGGDDAREYTTEDYDLSRLEVEQFPGVEIERTWDSHGVLTGVSYLWMDVRHHVRIPAVDADEGEG